MGVAEVPFRGLSVNHDSVLIAAYVSIGVATARLAYSIDLARLVALARSQGWDKGGEAEAFWRLMTLRKNKLLPRIVHGRSA
jgi:hypothetical protein